jgi:hypothetical protein
MIELPIGPASTPAPYTVNWSERYSCIAAVCAMKAKHAEHRGYVEDARLDALHRIEMGIAESLQRGGTHPQAAAFLAFQFVDRAVAVASSALRA